MTDEFFRKCKPDDYYKLNGELSFSRYSTIEHGISYIPFFTETDIAATHTGINYAKLTKHGKRKFQNIIRSLREYDKITHISVVSLGNRNPDLVSSLILKLKQENVNPALIRSFLPVAGAKNNASHIEIKAFIYITKSNFDATWILINGSKIRSRCRS